MKTRLLIFGLILSLATPLALGDPMVIRDGVALTAGLQLASQPPELRVLSAVQGASSQTGQTGQTGQASGGEHSTSGEVSSLPLNERDFTKLLALAGGTTTDTNGANNFTLQFAINGQRGTTAVFAMDGIYTTDPELGGATFSNFNVDAIQEIQSQSGVMPPEIGAGAAGYTNVVTKSGTDQMHGDAFEFLRNASLDARNFFDRRSFRKPRPHSAVPAQRVRIHARRTGDAAGHLQRPRTHLLLRAVPGFPPGAGHHPGALRADGGGASRNRHLDLSRRYPDGAG